MRLISPAFTNNQNLPTEYTYEGLNINPPLIISEVPAGAKSLALIFIDLDALMDIWVHWLLYNINPAITRIEAGSLPEGATPGLNSLGSNVFDGPCPATGVHRYIFKLYALDSRLDLAASQAEAAKFGFLTFLGNLYLLILAKVYSLQMIFA